MGQFASRRAGKTAKICCVYVRIGLTLLYAAVLAAVTALDNLDAVPDVLPLAVWLLAPVIGFLVGRWWVVLAALGANVGRPIGWDPAENDGNPALWLPYLISSLVFIGALLLLGAAIAAARARRPAR